VEIDGDDARGAYVGRDYKGSDSCEGRLVRRRVERFHKRAWGLEPLWSQPEGIGVIWVGSLQVRNIEVTSVWPDTRKGKGKQSAIMLLTLINPTTTVGAVPAW
jgi:hypothetical protein